MEGKKKGIENLNKVHEVGELEEGLCYAQAWQLVLGLWEDLSHKR